MNAAQMGNTQFKEFNTASKEEPRASKHLKNMSSKKTFDIGQHHGSKMDTGGQSSKKLIFSFKKESK